MPKGVYPRKEGVYPRIPGIKRPWLKRVPRVVICLNCYTQFNRPPSDKKRKYCSLKCNQEHYRGKEHWSYKETKISTQGYYLAPDRPAVKRLPVHRLIAENLLGRPLKRSEVVHHIDGNKLNNEHSNLLICDVAYHAWLHAEMSYRYQKEKFTRKVNA